MSKPIFNVNVWDFGERPAAWRSSRLGATANIDAQFWIDTATLIERSGLHGLFLADSPSLNEDPQLRPHRFMEPFTILATLAAHTSRIGLIATASTTYNDPLELAERAMLIDRLSGGRFGINAVTTTSPIAAKLFGRDEHPERAARYQRAGEFAHVYRAYWAARRSGSAFDFDGRFFDYRRAAQAPFDIPAEPVMLQAGGSAEGARLAAQHADAVFSAEMQKDAAVRNRATVHRLADSLGRPAPKILPGLSVCVGSTVEEARSRFDHYEQLGPPGFLLRHLNRLLGTEIGLDELDTSAKHLFARYDIADETASGSLGFRKSVHAFAAQDDLTVRQLLYHFGGYGHQIVFGTPERIADLIEDWLRAGACDGFNLIPDVFPSGLERFVDHVLPILRQRNLFSYPDEPGSDAQWRGLLDLR